MNKIWALIPTLILVPAIAYALFVGYTVVLPAFVMFTNSPVTASLTGK